MLDPAGAAAAVHAMPTMGGGAWMLAAHAAATLLTALVIASGDRAATWLLTWLGTVTLLVQGARVRPAVRARRRPVAPAATSPLRRLTAGTVSFRGPPAGVPGALARAAC